LAVPEGLAVAVAQSVVLAVAVAVGPTTGAVEANIRAMTAVAVNKDSSRFMELSS
jgi:hypothetical protein